MSYRELLEELDRWFVGATTAAGPDVVLCRRGCAACCHGPFDISAADAQLAHEGLSRLGAPAQARLRTRAHAQAGMNLQLAPSWPAPFDVDAISDTEFDRLTEALALQPCPALGDDGACTIYDARPATCRMTGHAMRTCEGDVLENVCPILDTSPAYAMLTPAVFNLSGFEDRAEEYDALAMTQGWTRTTVAGALLRSSE